VGRFACFRTCGFSRDGHGNLRASRRNWLDESTWRWQNLRCRHLFRGGRPAGFVGWICWICRRSAAPGHIGKWVFGSQIGISPVLFPIVLVIAVLVTFAGSAVAIRRAMKLDPVYALRENV